MPEPHAPRIGVVALGRRWIDLRTGQVGGVAPAVRLSERERHVFEVLCAAGGETVESGSLEQAVWGEQLDGSRRLAVTVGRLRRKVEDHPSSPRFLLTVSGAGYRLEGVERRRHTPGEEQRPALTDRDDLTPGLVRWLKRQRGWLTLVGAPGSGTTQVARWLMWRARRQGYPAAMVRCFPGQTRRQLLLDVLSAHGQTATDPWSEAVLQEQVLGLAGLVVFDDVDVLDAAHRQWLTGWLGQSPAATVVATARRPEGFFGEAVCAVPPWRTTTQTAVDEAARSAVMAWAAWPGPTSPELLEQVLGVSGAVLDQLVRAGQAELDGPYAMLRRSVRDGLVGDVPVHGVLPAARPSCERVLSWMADRMARGSMPPRLHAGLCNWLATLPSSEWTPVLSASASWTWWAQRDGMAAMWLDATRTLYDRLRHRADVPTVSAAEALLTALTQARAESRDHLHTTQGAHR